MGLSLGERNVAIQSRTDKGPSRAAEIAHVVDDEMSMRQGQKFGRLLMTTHGL